MCYVYPATHFQRITAPGDSCWLTVLNSFKHEEHPFPAPLQASGARLYRLWVPQLPSGGQEEGAGTCRKHKSIAAAFSLTNSHVEW